MVLPCRSCCAAIAEFKTTIGPLIFIGRSGASRLARFVDPKRGRLTEEEIAEAYRLVIGLTHVIGEVFDRVRGRADGEAA